LHTHLIYYSPSNPAANEPFELTGFTFNFNSNSLALYIENSSSSVAITKVRIHGNSFLNCLANGSNYSDFVIYGAVCGVFDNNTLTGDPHTDIYGDGKSMWENFSFVYGNENAWYIEDNTYTTGFTAVSGFGGGRFVFRYNTFTYTGTNGLQPWFDAHGDAPQGEGCAYYGTMGCEIYGNKLTTTGMTGGSCSNSTDILHHRGGKGLAYWNKVVPASGCSGCYADIRLQEEYNATTCSYSNNPIPAHVSDAYYWNNRANTTLVEVGVVEGYSGYIPLVENVDYHSNTGCGTTLPSTCTMGDGYWLTTQSCSAVADANVGANPTTPLSGKLYKCTATNTWTEYYVPLKYPHPLRKPNPPMGVRIQ